MRKKITVEAPAKINLTLDITGKRPDGYHELVTVMHQVNLYDLIGLEETGDVIEILSDSDGIPAGEDNLAYKAAAAFMKYIQQPIGVRITINKNIPVGAGLAGGSTDAAAVLVGLNFLRGNKLTGLDLQKIAAIIGSDVPFCLSGQYYEKAPGVLAGSGCTALARGRGEILSSLPSQTIPFILLVKPDFQLSTAEVYAGFNINNVKKAPDTDAFLQAWYNNDIMNMGKQMVNVLESVSISQKPEIGEIKTRMMEKGALRALMSGSGPTVFGLFLDGTVALRAEKEFKRSYREVYLVSSYKRGD